MVMKQSNLYDGNPYTGKAASFLYRQPLIFVTSVPDDVLETKQD